MPASLKKSLVDFRKLFVFYLRSGTYFVLVVDAYGAGSGGGVAKLLSLSPGQKVWKLLSCFSYTDVNFDWTTASTKGLQDAVESYLSTHPNAQYTSGAEKHCSDFRLIQNGI